MNPNQTWAIYDTAIGKLTIGAKDGEITMVFFGEHPLAGIPAGATPLTDQAALQIREYLEGKRKTFNLLLHPHGTPFQESVWNALLDIPYGETRSYQEIAAAIGKPKACRAVGMANNRNPISILIPCHRVIGKNGKLVGYGGGLDVKERLLALERQYYNDSRCFKEQLI